MVQIKLILWNKRANLHLELHEPPKIQQHKDLHPHRWFQESENASSSVCSSDLFYLEIKNIRSANNIIFYSHLTKQDPCVCVPVKEGAGIATSSAVIMFCLPWSDNMCTSSPISSLPDECAESEAGPTCRSLNGTDNECIAAAQMALEWKCFSSFIESKGDK